MIIPTHSREDPGVFKTSVNIPKGRYEYKFLVDGDWMLDSKMVCVIKNYVNIHTVHVFSIRAQVIV